MQKHLNIHLWVFDCLSLFLVISWKQSNFSLQIYISLGIIISLHYSYCNLFQFIYITFSEYPFVDVWLFVCIFSCYFLKTVQWQLEDLHLLGNNYQLVLFILKFVSVYQQCFWHLIYCIELVIIQMSNSNTLSLYSKWCNVNMECFKMHRTMSLFISYKLKRMNRMRH